MKVRIHPVITEKGVQYIVKKTGIWNSLRDVVLSTHILDEDQCSKRFASRSGLNWMVPVLFSSPLDAIKECKRIYGCRIKVEMWEG